MDLPYHIAQRAIADLKAAVYLTLKEAPLGLTNAQIGRSLGIYMGHERHEHEGHISRVLLSLMATEEIVLQDEGTKRWTLRTHKD